MSSSKNNKLISVEDLYNLIHLIEKHNIGSKTKLVFEDSDYNLYNIYRDDIRIEDDEIIVKFKVD